MARSKGRAARVAVDPETFISFLDTNTAIVTGGSPRRTRRILNGHTIGQANDGRMIRRWRSGQIEGITKQSAENFLGRYGLTFQDFVLWAMLAGRQTHIRNNDH